MSEPRPPPAPPAGGKPARDRPGERKGHPDQLDLFVAFVGDVPLRDDREAMSLPLVSLSKGKRTTPIEWKSDDGFRWVRVTANATNGMATIWDFDVVIWAVSQLNEAVEHSQAPPRVLHFHPHDLLRSIGRTTSGDDYRDLEAALRRLKGTVIETNVRLPKAPIRRRAGLGWIDAWSHDVDEQTGRSRGMKLTVSQWIYEGVTEHRDVLAVSPAYFDISSGLARWLYRLARRHAGKQPEGWRWTFRHLHERSGSTQTFKDFSRDLRRVIAANKLPEYKLEEIEGQHGDAVLWAMRDPARAKVPQRRVLRRLTIPERHSG